MYLCQRLCDTSTSNPAAFKDWASTFPDVNPRAWRLRGGRIGQTCSSGSEGGFEGAPKKNK